MYIYIYLFIYIYICRHIYRHIYIYKSTYIHIYSMLYKTIQYIVCICGHLYWAVRDFDSGVRGSRRWVVCTYYI